MLQAWFLHPPAQQHIRRRVQHSLLHIPPGQGRSVLSGHQQFQSLHGDPAAVRPTPSSRASLCLTPAWWRSGYGRTPVCAVTGLPRQLPMQWCPGHCESGRSSHIWVVLSLCSRRHGYRDDATKMTPCGVDVDIATEMMWTWLPRWHHAVLMWTQLPRWHHAVLMWT